MVLSQHHSFLCRSVHAGACPTEGISYVGQLENGVYSFKRKVIFPQISATKCTGLKVATI